MAYNRILNLKKYKLDILTVKTMLKLNNIYKSLKKVNGEWHAGHIQWGFHYDFLRFYEDGVVIQCNNPHSDKLEEWFYLDNTEAYFYKGTYSLKQNKISITIPVEIGKLEYEGEANSNRLILFWKNKKVNSNGMDYYEII